jgi:putative peptide zinc metalloprotease protein
MTALVNDAVPVDDAVSARPTSGAERVYRLAEGTELLGEFQDSAFETPKYLVRRADGQVMQLPGLLYRVAGSLDGRDAQQIAAELTTELGQELTADHVSFLVDERLRPVGVVAPDDPDGAPASTELVRPDFLLALRYRVGVVPAAVSWRVAGLLRSLFTRPVWVLALGAFVAVHLWIVAQGDLLGRSLAGVDQIVRAPGLILALYAVGVLSAAWHECGHVTACRYGGARPGDMGIGLYVVWPAFYSTVTDAYRLDRIGRLRTDLGGMYFDTMFMTGVGLLYLYTGEPWVLVMLLGMLAETAWQFLPSIRLDGYYILADLVGLPDLFSYLWPALASLRPGRPAHPKIRELRPRARRVILTWVALVVPMLLFYVVAFLVFLPHVLPVVWNGFLDYLDTLNAAVRVGDLASTAVGVLELFFLLVLPWIGGVLMTSMTLGMIRQAASAKWGWGWAEPGHWVRARRVAAIAAVGGLAAALVWRVAAVAGSAVPSDAETRIVAGALDLGRDAAPGIGPGEVAVREQLVAYAWLTGAFDRHVDVLTGARELAVLATAVLVLCFLAMATVLRWRLWTVALPLASVLAMGPAVLTLATLGPGVVGAAWAAVGVTLLVAARNRHGRHRRRRLKALHRAMTGLGGLALGIAVVTAPFLAVPLAVGAVLLVLRPGDRSSRRVYWVPLVLGGFALTALAAFVVPVLLRAPAATVLTRAEWQVLVLVAGLVVIGGLVQPALRGVAGIAASLLLLTLVPAAGADAVLPLAVCATAGLGALVVQDIVRRPVESRPHPLLRGALAVPVLVIVVVGALFLPTRPPALPHGQVAQWITDPASPAPTLTTPPAVWAELIRNGVPADRLALREEAAPMGAASWEVVEGEPEPGPRKRMVFGSGDGALTVLWPE